MPKQLFIDVRITALAAKRMGAVMRKHLAGTISDDDARTELGRLIDGGLRFKHGSRWMSEQQYLHHRKRPSSRKESQ